MHRSYQKTKCMFNFAGECINQDGKTEESMKILEGFIEEHKNSPKLGTHLINSEIRCILRYFHFRGSNKRHPGTP